VPFISRTSRRQGKSNSCRHGMALAMLVERTSLQIEHMGALTSQKHLALADDGFDFGHESSCC